MLYITEFFLFASLLLYIMFGGADFGAGILEAFAGRQQRKRYQEIVSQALAPVWEANHVWLIVAIVILFMGFPKAYAQISTIFHVPLTILLLGIVLRGASFAFRYYDPFKDKSHELYTHIFTLSSFVTPILFGVTFGGIYSHRAIQPGGSYYSVYIHPWLSPFSMALGLFTCALFAYIAAVYLFGETDDKPQRQDFFKRARIAMIATVISGGFVFAAAHMQGVPLIKRYLTSTVCIVSVIIATASLFGIHFTLQRGMIWLPRIILGAQVVCIIAAWSAAHYPNLLTYADGNHLTLLNAHAPLVTLSALSWALMLGSLIIFPSLIFLYNVFKSPATPGSPNAASTASTSQKNGECP
ncbi:MAG: cytochrome d ubiquinol oxidase subunit II [Chitinivibrionales bacterium]|nr:cytochrome d ubiquinol oxidase subunit II [Chitinivibrionales bacterium]